MEENKEVLQLLKQIEKASRRQTLLCIALCIFALVTALCCIITFVSIKQMLAPVGEALPEILNTIPQITGVIGQMETVLGNLETTTQQLASLDFGAMVADVDELVVTAQQSLDGTMKKLNSVDFAALNKAIKDLSSVIEPLAKVASIFGK